MVQRGMLRLLRIPPEPRPPAGSPDSLAVFRSSRKLFRIRLALWGLKQAVGLLGFVVFLLLFGFFDEEAAFARLERIGERAARDAETLEKVHKIQEGLRRAQEWVPVIETLEWFGLGFFLVQLPLSYAWLRLEYENRCYLATDHSLRLRDGLWNVREMTLTYSNVQNVTIEQGPLQRLLGIADLVVQTAGGGGSSGRGPRERHGKKRSLHEGRLQDVENPERIRELIQSHLRRLRDGGLGDAEDVQPAQETVSPLDAARELLRETRALRAALER